MKIFKMCVMLWDEKVRYGNYLSKNLKFEMKEMLIMINESILSDLLVRGFGC